MPKDLDEIFKAWDKGEHTFNESEEALMALKFGEKLGNTLSECTICPVGNGTCEHFMMVECYGILPGTPGKLRQVMVCSLGIEDIDSCPLSK
jgi:hypothetical protein